MKIITFTKSSLCFLIIIIKAATKAESLININSTEVMTSNPHISKLSAKSLQETIMSLSLKLEGLQAIVGFGSIALASGFLIMASGFVIRAKEAITSPITMPIGFIYVQLPNEKPPKEIWPKNIWKDVSSEYAGDFFRVEGGTSEPFGNIQEESSPKLQAVKFQSFKRDTKMNSSATLKKGIWSDFIQTGLTIGNPQKKNFMHIKFYTNKDEVRPRNKAMRLWRRIE